MKTSPTQRSLALLRSEGWTAHVVEHWNPHARIRQDVGGWVDILAYRPSEWRRMDGVFGAYPAQIMGVQTTTASNMAARIAKMKDLPSPGLWKRAGGLVEVHGWAKKGPRGKRKTWQVRRVRL